jgi:hypothetical protein
MKNSNVKKYFYAINSFFIRTDIQEEQDDDAKRIRYKTSLRNLIFVLVASALIINSIIIFADSAAEFCFHRYGSMLI